MHPTDEITVAILIGKSNPTSITVVVPVAMDKSRLTLFVIFKCMLGGRVK